MCRSSTAPSSSECSTPAWRSAATRTSTSSLNFAPSASPSSKVSNSCAESILSILIDQVGVKSTIDRTSRRRPVGWRCTWTGRSNGSIRCSSRWAPHGTPSPPSANLPFDSRSLVHCFINRSFILVVLMIFFLDGRSWLCQFRFDDKVWL